MSSRDPALRVPATPSSLAALARQLREGPLLHLQELQTQMADLSDGVAGGSTSRVEDLERLVRISVAAMEHFNAFTREFAAVLRELTDDHRERH